MLLDEIRTVRVALAAETAEHAAPRVQARSADGVPLRTVVAVHAAVVGATGDAFGRLCCALDDFAQDRLRRTFERPGDPVGRATVVEQVLDAQAFARRQPGLGFAVLFFGRRQRRLHRHVPFFSFRTECPDALEDTIFL